ncbi:hypothetical protein [Deinococcus hopiensis]|uniref:hypothetical protein n=1 Tax=Deinococcus hopiensis TaxID=309885 RepID=UPI000A0553C4|nr:hypothetical protein [Deinococcus hopiensis]
MKPVLPLTALAPLIWGSTDLVKDTFLPHLPLPCWLRCGFCLLDWCSGWSACGRRAWWITRGSTGR